MSEQQIAQDAGMRKERGQWVALDSDLERFADAVRVDERMRLAKQCAELPFGDTSASFACWIARGGKAP